jgi:hypothetical protein
MQNSKRQIAFSSILALLLYLLPNLVQDSHRILGHQVQFGENYPTSDVQVHNYLEKCPVCIFEFNVVNEIENLVYTPLLQAETHLFVAGKAQQVQDAAFFYYDLRAPPQA